MYQAASRGVLALCFGLLLSLAAAPASADDQSNCPPGQPSGRPPGQPPNQPGPPDGRPPNYPPGECNLRLSRGSVARGDTVTVAGSGFAPGATVRLSLQPRGSDLGTLTASDAGAFSTEVVIPAGAPVGLGSVVASSGNRQLTAALEITAGRPASAVESSGLLPRTGQAVAALVVAGLGLVGLGTIVALAARRRRPDSFET